MRVKNFKFLVFCIAICFFAACGGGSKETQQTIPKEKLIGIPQECMEKIHSKDSVGYYSCCENLNACWYNSELYNHTYGDSIIYKDSLIRQKFYLKDTIKTVSPEELKENVKRTMKMLEDKVLELDKNREDKANESKH